MNMKYTLGLSFRKILSGKDIECTSKATVSFSYIPPSRSIESNRKLS